MDPREESPSFVVRLGNQLDSDVGTCFISIFWLKRVAVLISAACLSGFDNSSYIVILILFGGEIFK